MSQAQYDVLIVGAGLSGLTAARLLHKQGLRCLLVEASAEVGGRIKTDEHEGFLLDHGFQVFLSAYPEAKALLDYEALNFKRFFNGSLVWTGKALQKVADPWRHPVEGVQSIYNDIGGLKDKLKVGELRHKVLNETDDAWLTKPETTTLAALQAFGFSDAMIEIFFRPFLGGIFLESQLTTSSRFFEFVFRMFSQGEAVLPAQGMQAIPRLLAAGLPEGAIRLNSRVVKIEAGQVTLESGEQLSAPTILLATDAKDATQLIPALPPRAFNAVYCLYFAAPEAPVDQPILMLNGVPGQRVNNVCVPSNLAPAYAPAGQHLISVSVLDAGADLESLESVVRQELQGWFGESVAQWRHLKTYAIPRALPQFTVPGVSMSPHPVQLSPGLFHCGDYLESPSINGAMATGRRAAEAILQSLKPTALTH